MPAANESNALDLRTAIEGLLDGVSFAELRRASDRLSAAYRAGPSGGSGSIRTAHDRLAYLAARLPSTFEATRAVLGELRDRAPRVRAESLLELGAGPAPGLWAAERLFPELSCATHVEVDAGMAQLGRRLLKAGHFDARVESTWFLRDVARARELGAHDLVLVGYVLGELPASARDELVDAAWNVTAAALVIVEPGTPAGADRVIRARARLIDQGGNVAAPCPHAGACPLASGDWCHFAARVDRSSVQRRLKGGSLGYEDEKYAYVAVTRGDADRCAARVLRRPVAQSRRVSLRLCTSEGLRQELVTRREGERYRAARKTRWGDGWQPAAGEAGDGTGLPAARASTA